jgi:hypothetical protein
MNAYKFLRAGRVGRFSGFEWPQPGEWVEASAGLDPCREGVHVVTPDGLPEWLDDELWRVEVAGETTSVGPVLVAERGRLVSRVDAWDEAAAAEFADACVARLAERAEEDARLEGYAQSAQRVVEGGAAADPRFVPLVGFILRHAAEDAGRGGWERELAWQARFLAERLGL